MKADQLLDTGTPKSRRLAALEGLQDHLRLLVALQRNCHERASLSDDPLSIANERLALYDRFLPLLVTCLEDLQTQFLAKQPGGAPQNPHRALAFKILTTHYIADGEVLQAKVLVKKVMAELQNPHPDEDGRDPFMLRVARKEIKFFKWCLSNPLIDQN